MDDNQNTDEHIKKKRKSDNPFEVAGYELVQIRFQIEKMIKGFSEKDRKDPNYKQFVRDIITEVTKAVDHKSREDHSSKTKWHKILDLITLIFNNPVFLAIICIILGAVLGNVAILNAILNFFKG